MRKGLALLLAVAMVLSMAACRGGNGPATSGGQYTDPYGEYEDYDEKSQAIYDDTLGDFIDAYEAAKEADQVSVRYALMAIAEAKLLSSAVMLPLTAGGGNYAISRMAPYTMPNALWGNDADRFHNALVTTRPITAAHRDEMKAQWARQKGKGTYEAWAKTYLTEKGYTLKDSYAQGYTADPQTWDILSTSRSADSEAIVNTYDGLYEYDCEGTLRPALAESHTVTENGDGTVRYTFKLRSGLKWVDSQGRTVADVRADDFVAGMQHMMDAAGGLEYLVEGVIVNADAYLSGDVTDFSQVGVHALDDTTVEYTLTGDIPYFMTMLGYGVFAPMCRTYYLSQGGKFGRAFDGSAADYSYGKTPDNIAYCGPYLVANATAENTIVFRANPVYWNADGIKLKTITWMYNDGKDALKAYNDTISGTIDGAGLNFSSVEKAKSDGVFSELAYISPSNATTFFAFYNLNRTATANFNDASVNQSPKTEEQRLRAVTAMHNIHFRRALSFAADRAGYNAQVVGEDLKLNALRNSFIPGNFVWLEEQVTVDINDKPVTYPAGTWYGQIMQDQLEADGMPIRVWDPDAESGVGSSDGFDGWYDPKAAAAELETAIAELARQGMEISPQQPIYLDLPYFSGSDNDTNRANAYRQSVEKALNGAVKVNLIACPDKNGVLYAGYYVTMGNEANYDVYDRSGWGPDYGDPQTYLDSFLPRYEGYMTRMFGIF